MMHNARAFKYGLIALLFSLAVAYPALHRGVVMTLDSIASPIRSYDFILFHISSEYAQKMFLLAIIYMGIYTLLMHVRSSSNIVCSVTSMYFVLNLFYIERLAVGQWRMLGALALLSLAVLGLRRLHQSQRVRYFIFLGVGCIGSVMLYHRAYSFIEVIALAYGLAWLIIFLRKKAWRTTIIPLVGMIGVVLVSRYIGFHFGDAYGYQVDSAQLPLFSLGVGGVSNKIVGAISYIGFWAERAQRLPMNVGVYWYWYLPGLIALVTSIIGWREILKKERIFGVFLIILYILSLCVTISNDAFGDPQKLYNGYLFFGFTGLRETGKFMGLMVLSQGIGFGYGFEWLLQKLRSGIAVVWVGIQVISLALFLVILFNFMQWALTPVVFPQKLISFAQTINAQRARTIVFPWHRYQTYPFTRGRVIDQIGPILFDSYVFNDMLEYNNVLVSSQDPWQYDMGNVVIQPSIHNATLTDLVRAKDIKRIVIMKTNDFDRYIVWARDMNLKELENNDTFIAFEI